MLAVAKLASVQSNIGRIGETFRACHWSLDAESSEIA